MLAPHDAAAQQAARPALTITCPATIQAEYRRISAFEPDGAQGKVDGFKPVFLKGSVRMINASLAVGKTGEELSTIMPDDTPGNRIVWSKLDAAGYEAGESSHVKCEYEGGMYLEHALPASTKSCTLQQTETKPTPTVKRTFVTRAVFTCR